jgi:phage shock protein PspC (stress-responsive transcriptional regulator)
MSGETSEAPTPAVDEELAESFEIPITGRVVLAAMGGGLLGTAAMLPVLVGVPSLLGLFRTGPVTRFAGFAEFFGIEPTVTLGIVLFALGGTIVLPLTFLVVGAFLPPETPRYLRGATFATAFWFGFLPGFWPSAGLLTTASYVLFSLAGHWVYGLTLGYVLTRTTGLPQHEV